MPNTSSSLTVNRGLSEEAAKARLKAEGYNELPRPERRTQFRIILDVLREPMLALLVGSGAIYLALGDTKEALILLAFAMLSIIITVVQESRTEHILEALRDLTSPRALVIRDGERKRIAGREVVRGDVVVLTEGDRVPADGIVLQCEELQADESLLTGESVPVRKVARADGAPEQNRRAGGDDLPYVFAGSVIVLGSAICEVVATGPRSEIGKIGQALHTIEAEPPRLHRQTRRLVRYFALIGGAVSILAVLLYGAFRGGWLDALLAGIALGMSMLPEEFPVVLTVFMAMGAWRISHARVLTRRTAAIETLGSATVLCTDKTGTLTENRMSVAELRLSSGEIFRHSTGPDATMPEMFRQLVEFGLLASAPDPFDPMEKAIHELSHLHLADTPHIHGSDWKLVHTYGLRPGLLVMSQVWQVAGEQEFVIATKGAPEAVVDLCHLQAENRAAVISSMEAMAAQGLRVLGVARATSTGDTWPLSQRDFNFGFLGLIGLEDPLRASVPEAVKECRSAGIRVVMITGDYPVTARAIARQAGIEVADVIPGSELDSMQDKELARRVRSAPVFARITPEQKLRIVNALKASGEIVAMTGDGVNDAPSLKAAHIGIAMGARGTDVAREASSIVLLDDDFGSIVQAMRLGRRIYDNLRKAVAFIFAVHVPIAGLALMPLLFGLPILLAPAHIALLEMVIDPVCSLVFEAEREEEDVMSRPPRSPDEPFVSRRLVGWSLLQGILALFCVGAIFIVSIERGLPEDQVRALTFFSLVVTIFSLILVNRSFTASLITALRRPNRMLVLVVVAVATILSLTLLWPGARELFRFGTLGTSDLAVTFGVGLAVLVALDGLKFLYQRWQQGHRW